MDTIGTTEIGYISGFRAAVEVAQYAPPHRAGLMVVAVDIAGLEAGGSGRGGIELSFVATTGSGLVLLSRFPYL